MGMDALITGYAHVGIRVRDLSISRAFYEGLGFEFVAGPVGPEPVAILAHRSGTVINFILNAAEASPEGGEIVVRLRRIARDGGGSERVEIAVMDHGTGISPDDLKLVWDPLFTTKAEGTGLRLAICRQIVKEHGGSVRIRSRLGEGTVVTVTLPVTGD